MDPATSARATPVTGLPSRIAVTFGVIAVLALLRRTPIPALDPEAIDLFTGDSGGGMQRFSVLALGLAPLVSASILVELFALVASRLGALRHGTAAERAPLTRATWLLAAALALFQGYGIATLLQQTGVGYGRYAVAWGAGPMLVVTATLAAGALLAGFAAVLISRHGIGGGVPVLLAAATLEEIAGAAPGATRRMQEAGLGQGPLPFLILLALAVLVPLAVRHRRAQEGPRVPFPTSGLDYLQLPGSLLLLPGALAGWFPSVLPLADVARSESTPAEVFRIALSVALAALFSRLFCPAGEVAAAYARALPGAHAEDAVRAAVATAHRRALVLGVAVSALPLVMWQLGFGFTLGVPGIVTLAVIVAVALDLADELRARRLHGPLVSARAFQRLFAVAPALEALAAAGIPAHARGPRYRALLWFFAPYAPVDVLVPPERLAEAEAICARALGRG